MFPTPILATIPISIIISDQYSDYDSDSDFEHYYVSDYDCLALHRFRLYIPITVPARILNQVPNPLLFFPIPILFLIPISVTVREVNEAGLPDASSRQESSQAVCVRRKKC